MSPGLFVRCKGQRTRTHNSRLWFRVKSFLTGLVDYLYVCDIPTFAILIKYPQEEVNFITQPLPFYIWVGIYTIFCQRQIKKDIF